MVMMRTLGLPSCNSRPVGEQPQPMTVKKTQSGLGRGMLGSSKKLPAAADNESASFDEPMGMSIARAVSNVSLSSIIIKKSSMNTDMMAKVNTRSAEEGSSSLQRPVRVSRSILKKKQPVVREEKIRGISNCANFTSRARKQSIFFALGVTYCGDREQERDDHHGDVSKEQKGTQAATTMTSLLKPAMDILRCDSTPAIGLRVRKSTTNSSMPLLECRTSLKPEDENVETKNDEQCRNSEFKSTFSTRTTVGSPTIRSTTQKESSGRRFTIASDYMVPESQKIAELFGCWDPTVLAPESKVVRNKKQSVRGSTATASKTRAACKKDDRTVEESLLSFYGKK